MSVKVNGSKSGDKKTYETTTQVSGGWRSTVAPRSVVIQRSQSNQPGVRGGLIQRSLSNQMYSGLDADPTTYQVVSQTGVTSVKDCTEKEKKDMQDLNGRFASYIEKVRFLEAQNRKLGEELGKLKQTWGKETNSVKNMYESELEELRKLMDENEKQKAELQIKVDSLEQELGETNQVLDEVKAERDRVKEANNEQSRYIINLEAELKNLRQTIEGLESDKKQSKNEITRLMDALKRARLDLDAETLAHIEAENKGQTLEEEIEFLKNIHQEELKELGALAYRDTTSENREFWKNEMAQAIRDLQDAYDEKLEQMREELKSKYTVKVMEFKTASVRHGLEATHSKDETKRLRQQLADLRAKLADLESRNVQKDKEVELLQRELQDKERDLEHDNTELRNEIAQLRAEMEAILKELQELINTKLGLEMEIAAYRKLLEGEESRVQRQGSQEGKIEPSNAAVNTAVPDHTKVVKGEMSAKTTYQRSAKGPVAICDCAADGKYVCLENGGRKEENIGGWRVVRNIDGQVRTDIVLDADFKLKAGSKCKLYALNCKPSDASANDIEVKTKSWEMGANIVTKLVNTNGDDRATHVQKTTYSSVSTN